MTFETIWNIDISGSFKKLRESFIDPIRSLCHPTKESGSSYNIYSDIWTDTKLFDLRLFRRTAERSMRFTANVTEVKSWLI